MFKNEKS